MAILSKNITLTGLALIGCFLLEAQKQVIDTSRINQLNKLAYELRNNSPDSSVLIAKQTNQYSKKRNYSLGLAESNIWEATAKTNLGKYEEAISLFSNAITILTKSHKKENKLKSSRLLAKAYNNLGNVFWYKGIYPEALKNQLLSLKIKETIKDEHGMAASYNNIGNIYALLENFEEAKINYLRSQKIYIKIGDKKGIADSYNNLGLVYYNKFDFVSARKNYAIALKLNEEIGDKQGIGISYTNIGSALEEEKKLDLALENYFIALKIKEEINDQFGLVITYINIGSILLSQNKLVEAKKYFIKAQLLSTKLELVEELKKSYEGLSQLALANNDYKEALIHYKNFILMRDSLVNDENSKKVIQQQMTYEFEKEQAADSIKNVERAKQETIKHEQEIKQQRIYTYGGIIGFSLMCIVAFVSFRAFRNKQKANQIIAEQKMLVEMKQSEIIDSIKYASRIQKALLPSNKYIRNEIKRLNETK